MRAPLGWLREFAPTDLAPSELADLITHRGVKVEAVLYPWAGLEGVVVVRVLEVRDHPRSDKLCLARIQHGSGEAELVVGVRNMAAGDLVPWAPPGARVPVLDEPLGRREIRGVLSEGMLCSPRELAIGTEHEGILLLNDAGLELGTISRPRWSWTSRCSTSRWSPTGPTSCRCSAWRGRSPPRPRCRCASPRCR